MSTDAPNPLDRASFYIEHMKYGDGPERIERVEMDAIASQLETLLRDAAVTTMTGAELVDAIAFYGDSFARHFAMPAVLAHSVFLDGVMHGIAFAAGLEAERPA